MQSGLHVQQTRNTSIIGCVWLPIGRSGMQLGTDPVLHAVLYLRELKLQQQPGRSAFQWGSWNHSYLKPIHHHLCLCSLETRLLWCTFFPWGFLWCTQKAEAELLCYFLNAVAHLTPASALDSVYLIIEHHHHTSYFTISNAMKHSFGRAANEEDC